MSTPLALCAAFISAWAVGYLIAATLWPRQRRLREDAPLLLPLGAIVGLGVTSISFFFASLLSSRPALVAGVFDGILALALWRLVRTRPPAPANEPSPPLSWLDWVLATVFAQAAAVASVLGWRAYSTEPYGGWDGWAIWNMHARFTLRAGPGWPEMLASPQLNWTHPDYPRLLPASVARLWAWAGNETPAAAGLVAAVFAIAVLALLVAVVARIRGRTAGLLGGLLVLGTPFFVTFSTNEHADIPLAAFMLAAVALGILGERWLAAGLCAGLAAWTKNEGLLFALVFGVAGALRLWRGRSAGGALQLAAGVGLALVPVLYFKLVLAPPNDLAGAPLAPRLGHLLDGARHHAILAAGWRDVVHFGEWHWSPWLALALPFAFWKIRRRLATGEWLVPALLAAMLGGYYLVYLLSPHDLAWHLNSSLVRLLLQLWPLALLGWCLVIPVSSPPSNAAPLRAATRAGFLVGSVVCALVLFRVLSGQLAANELATKSGVRVALADGWFGIERDGGGAWAWTAGNATLALQAGGPLRSRAVNLHFSLRSLAPRVVVVRQGSRVVWQGSVDRAFVDVRLTGLTLEGDGTTLEFTTDAAGTPESPAPGARSLAFALYNVRLE